MKDINKLQEEIVIKDAKKADKIWKELEKDKNLEYYLTMLTKEELLKIGYINKVKGLSSLKKQDLVVRIKDIILEKINHMLSNLDLERLEYLQEVLRHNGKKEYNPKEIINATYFRNRGILFTAVNNRKLFAVMPLEIFNLIKEKLDDNYKKKSKFNSEVINLISGLLYYYGVIECSTLKKLLEDNYEIYITEEELLDFILMGEEVGYDFQFEDNIIYHLDVDNPKELLSKINEFSLDYAKFDRKALLKVGKPDYIEENKQLIKLEKVLKELFIIDKEILKEEIEGFIIAIKNEVPIEDAADIFLQSYEIETEEERIILKGELEKIAWNVRKWTLKGRKMNEIEANSKTIVSSKNIGRNDKCPCGSNKKYKKCCGR
ncbi:SEC-C metal-binding domain-containing protein [Clostridium isatidis]|uniref:SEC-C metal-binding domain-containing protein n=1 Tax=Clostridium isatidis TaxID=182773 RepID=UPI001854B1B7|nr:hypothetical protein [Clostridiales bacterium]